MAKPKKSTAKPPRTIKRAREGKQPRARKPPAKRLKRATSPSDDPLLRHVGADVDRLSGSEGKQFGELGEGMKPAEDSDAKELARLRLAALEQSRKMPTSDESKDDSSAKSQKDKQVKADD